MKRRLRRFGIALVASAATLCGCVNFSNRVPAGSEYWGGYAAEKRFELAIDLTVIRTGPIDGLEGRRLQLVKESIGRWTDIAASAPTINRPAVLGVLKSGTKIRIAKLVRNHGLNFYFGTHDDLTLYAEVMDGPMAGRLVDISPVSKRWRPSNEVAWRYSPIPQFLRLAESET